METKTNFWLRCSSDQPKVISFRFSSWNKEKNICPPQMGRDWNRPTWACPPSLSLPTSTVWGLQANPPRSCCLLPTQSVNFLFPAHGLSSFPSPSQSRSFPPMKSSHFQIHPWSIPTDRALVVLPRARIWLLVCFFTSPAAIDSSFLRRGKERMASCLLSRAWGFTHPQVHVCLLTPRVGLSSHRGNTSSRVLSPKRCLAACAQGQLWCAAAVAWDQKCCVKGASRTLQGSPTLTWQLLFSLGTGPRSPRALCHRHCVSLASPDTGSAPSQAQPRQTSLKS